jgi:hypothetical protein
VGDSIASMKNILSLIACGLVCIVLLQYRVTNSDLNAGQKPLKITEWDALGYYLYLPSIFIYHDYKELNWLDSIDRKYSVTGGNGWQAMKADNGNYVFKYLGGVAFMQLPFFLVAHAYARQSHYPPDGFSPPYQYALGFGIIFYCLLATLLLRRSLLHYFSDGTTALTIVMVCLATNFVQYAAVDSGQSHAYIFLLYAAVLYTTLGWHQRPGIAWAALTGYIIGLATMSRPTEAIMLFIPLMWNTHTTVAARAKWQAVKQHKTHIYFAAAAGLAGILPQLIYWKSATGSFIFDVGSKWDFLNPHFRVLFGWEKGWFIYTPVTLLFITGMFFIRRFPFRKSVLWFCLLNIYIIIAWSDWRYGGSYSTRALVQSYPLFALPFAALADRIITNKWRIPFYLLCAWLLFVNLFQVRQYCSTVLHYNDMNRKYYGAIFLNAHPSPAAMSLLDNEELIKDETKYQQKTIARSDTPLPITFAANATMPALEVPYDASSSGERWLKIEASIYAPGCLWQSYLHTELKGTDAVKQTRIRLYSPISKDSLTNSYTCYISIPKNFNKTQLKVYLASPLDFKGVVKQVTVTEFVR